MKNQFARRILSLLLAVVMVAGMLPVGALASTVTEPEQSATQTSLPEESAPAPSETETLPGESVPAPSETETVPEESGETSLPTEPQEDAPAPLALGDAHPDYLSVY